MRQFPDEEMLRRTDRRSVQPHPDEARETEVGGVESTVPVDDQQVRERAQPAQRRVDRGKLPVREVSGDVGEFRTRLRDRDLLHLETIRVASHGRGEGKLSIIGNVDRADRLNGGGDVVFLHTTGHPPLFTPQPAEEALLRQVLHEPLGTPKIVDSRTSPHGRRRFVDSNRSTICADDAFSAWNLRMVREPRRDSPRGPDIAEGPRHRTACGDTFSWDPFEDRFEGLLESLHYDRAIVESPQNLVATPQGPVARNVPM